MDLFELAISPYSPPVLAPTLVLLVLASLPQPATPTPDPRPVAVELLRLEGVWNEAHLRNDAGALDRIWATDIVVILPRMSPMSKADALAFLRSGKFTFDGYSTSDASVRVYGDAAVVTGRLQRRRRLGNRVIEDDWRFTKAYLRQDGQWRVVSFHASEAP